MTSHCMTLETRTGAMHLEFDEDTPTVVAVASGHVGPKLAAWDLQQAGEFGRGHPEGWWYVVDTGAVGVPNPINLRLLKQIRRMPNITGYVVIAPKAPFRAIARVLRFISAPDAVVRTREEAMDFLAARRNTRST